MAQLIEHLPLQTGDILHCTGKRLLARLICKFTKSKFSHTALFIKVYGQPYIIDAQKNGVNLKPFYEWLEEYDYTFTATRFDEPYNEKEIAIRALSKTGLTGYDFEGLLIKQPIELITGKWKYKGDYEEQEKMYCSEYVSWVWQVPQSYRISPGDLYEFVVKRKAIVVAERY